MDKKTFFVFLDIIGCKLELVRQPNVRMSWTAKIENSYVKAHDIIVETYGEGSNPDHAIRNYMNLIHGDSIVIIRSENKREEFKVPY